MGAVQTMLSLMAVNRLDMAETHARARLADMPEDAALWRSLGSLLGLKGETRQALAALERAIALHPQDVATLLGYGVALHQVGSYAAARDVFIQGLAYDPDNVRLLVGLGQSLCVLGDMASARMWFVKALETDPSHVLARMGLAHCLFALGDWPGAWAAYEARLEMAQVIPAGLPQSQRWRSGPAPSSLIVFAEQGLGDCLQFSRFLIPLARQSCMVTLVCDARLFRLLSTLPCPVRFHDRSVPARFSDVAWAPFNSLPMLLGVTEAGLCPALPYLAPESHRVQTWRARIGQQGFRIGIMWQGNPLGLLDRSRFMALQSLAPLARIEGVRLISLQKGAGTEQIAECGFSVETLGEDVDCGADGFIDTAAVMASLDLVVSIDSSLIHLAGALGVPAVLLLKRHGPDWRWLNRETDTPWYPSVQVIRQTQEGDWDEVVARLCAMLHQGSEMGGHRVFQP